MHDQSTCERKIGKLMKSTRLKKHYCIVRNAIIIHIFADCGTCCENIEIESTSPDTIYTRIAGSYECYVDFYGKNVYKKHGEEMYLYWMYIKNIIGNVSDMATTDRWMVILTYIAIS